MSGPKKNNHLSLCQRGYIDQILQLSTQNQLIYPWTPKPASNLPQRSQDYVATRALKKEYQRIVGSLMYLMLCTRVDIAFAISKLSRFQGNPTPDHMP
ncbi:hypothetical protein N7535_006402 [Penicillium sp. DV-2018c]|nr:hypothetical protein N7461_007519 [Penicillium sp. DV-2018c]KAJ5567096.1 hypothetical protein N7535_006402 [Penicillium sp. DV-2018c]